MIDSVSLAPAIVAMNTDGGPVVFTWITEIKLVSTSATCFDSCHLTRKSNSDRQSTLPPLYARGHENIYFYLSVLSVLPFQVDKIV